MIETTRIYEFFPTGTGAAVALRRKYGSKRSGTIYIIGSYDEAQDVVRELYTRNGFVAPETINLSATHLVKQAVRMVNI